MTINFPPENLEFAESGIAAVRWQDPLPCDVFLPTAFIKPRKAGSSMIVAGFDDKEVSATLVVNAYTPEQVALGRQRYYEPVNGQEANRKACADCHVSGDGLDAVPDHSPTVTSYYADEVVLQVVREGRYPACVNEDSGTACECGSAEPGCFEDGTDLNPIILHVWDITAEEATGIVAYLRSLTPRGYEDILQ